MSDILAKINEKLKDTDKAAIKALSKEGLKELKEMFKLEDRPLYYEEMEHDLELYYKMVAAGEDKAADLLNQAVELWSEASGEAAEKRLGQNILKIALKYGEKIGKVIILALL